MDVPIGAADSQRGSKWRSGPEGRPADAQWVKATFKMKGTIMSKGQRGNKEAKKPKKAPAPAKPLAPGGSTPTASTFTPPRLRK